MDRVGPTTKEELRQSLDETVVQAYENGVNVADGAYQLHHDDPDIPDWELMLFLLQT
jgi:hypothetical protein